MLKGLFAKRGDTWRTLQRPFHVVISHVKPNEISPRARQCGGMSSKQAQPNLPAIPRRDVFSSQLFDHVFFQSLSTVFKTLGFDLGFGFAFFDLFGMD
jgi:hypothetical protein